MFFQRNLYLEKGTSKKMSKEKKRLYAKLLILVVCLFIVLRIFVLIWSRYESEATSNANVDIAFYLLNEDFQEMTLNLAEIFPQDNAYVYTFSIGNEEGEKTAEIDLSYDLKIRTTTNLPLTYSLYMNQDYEDENAINKIETNEIEQDEDGTYFRTMTTETETLFYKEPKTNVYQLIVHFPANYNTIEYQDIIEMLEITIDSRQLT